MSTLDFSETIENTGSSSDDYRVKQTKVVEDEEYNFFCYKCHHCMDVRWAVFCHSMAIFTQSMFVSGFIAGSMTTIERQYQLSANEIGVISAMYDVGQLLLLLPVSHFGATHWRKMHIESVGLLVMGIAAAVYASPHLATQHTEVRNGMLFCNATSVSSEKTSCLVDAKVVALRRWRWVFWFATLLFGMGASPLFSVGTSYVDENSPRNKAYFYIAVINSNIFLGAAFGSFLTGQFLNIHFDIDIPEDLRKYPLTQDSRRLGAWWIGPLMTSVFCLLLVIPLAGFPKHMPRYLGLQRQRLKKQKAECATLPQHSFAESMQLILRNWILLLLCISIACEMLFLTGVVYFGPKYMELTFSVSKSRAPVIMGSSTVVAGVSGVLLGGYITRRANFGLRGNLVMLVSVSLFNLIPVSAFLIRCTELHVRADETACNKGCGCRGATPFPLVGCGADERNYLSPCHAGCRAANATGYFNCRCIEARTSKRPEWTSGYCEAHCGVLLPLFIVIICVEVFGICLLTSPGINAVLCCVDAELRTIALGLAGLFARLFGSFPGPLIFAYLIDASCASWNIDCGTRGSCRAYHLTLVRQHFLDVTLTCKFVSMLSLCAALLIHLYRSMPFKRMFKATA